MLGPHTLTVTPPGGRDVWGNRMTAGGSVEVPGCFFQPVSTAEKTTAADTVTVAAWASMPPDTVIAADYEVTFGGRTYQVHGRPELHHTPAGPHHYEVQLTDTQG